MDFFDIESFIVLTEVGSFSAAAKQMCVTQPALSQRIRKLEEYLGYSLLVRQRGRMSIELTPLGEEFLQLAKQINTLCEKARSLSEEDLQQKLNVSINETVLRCMIPHVVRAYASAYPEVQLSAYSYYSEESYELVRNGTLDVAIVSRLFNVLNVNAIPIMREPWLFICGMDADYPELVHPEELDPERMLALCNVEKTVWYKYWFQNSSKNALGGYTLTFLMADAFQHGNWSVVPCSVAKYYNRKGICAIRELAVAPQPRIVYALTRDEFVSETAQNFLHCVREELLKLPDGTTLL